MGVVHLMHAAADMWTTETLERHPWWGIRSSGAILVPRSFLLR